MVVPLAVLPVAVAGGLGLLDLSSCPWAAKVTIQTAANINSDFICLSFILKNTWLTMNKIS